MEMDIWSEALTLLPFFQVPWPGSGGNEKFFFENESVSAHVKIIIKKVVVELFSLQIKDLLIYLLVFQ